MADDDSAELLLLEWLVWWRDSDESPAKMPAALHVRTAVWLIMQAESEGADIATVAREILRGSEGPS